MNQPLLVIVGETGSGKSALALELAGRLNGEIVCADSRTVYQGMDIGTAKPSPAEQASVPHHLLDVTTPDQPITVADFKKLADAAIADIQNRGKLPILVGGTGLYIDAVIYNFQFRPPGDPGLREQLSGLSVAALQAKVEDQGLLLPRNSQNPRHLVRTIETKGVASQRSPLNDATVIIGLRVSPEVLKGRLEARVRAMVAAGLEAEARGLAEKYDWDGQAMAAPAYRAFHEYIDGYKTLAEAEALFVHYDLQLAKRQRTWFKRNNSIHWFDMPVNPEQIVEYVTTSFAK